jgi:hypothetical protein
VCRAPAAGAGGGSQGQRLSSLTGALHQRPTWQRVCRGAERVCGEDTCTQFTLRPPHQQVHQLLYRQVAATVVRYEIALCVVCCVAMVERRSAILGH